jgi:predicted transcriptional regulator YdeE
VLPLKNDVDTPIKWRICTTGMSVGGNTFVWIKPCTVQLKKVRMEQYHLAGDMIVFCAPAVSFPDGVIEAHQKLHTMVPSTPARKYFGLSRPENGVISYYAATEEVYPGEAEKYGCNKITLKKGNYATLLIKDYMQDIPAIGKAFTQLLTVPGLDKDGYCVEWYLNDKDLQCMVRVGLANE